MESKDGNLSEENAGRTQFVAEDLYPSISPLKITMSPKSPRSPKAGHGKHGSIKGSPIKNDRHSHSVKDGRPKKGSTLPTSIYFEFFRCSIMMFKLYLNLNRRVLLKNEAVLVSSPSYSNLIRKIRAYCALR